MLYAILNTETRNVKIGRSRDLRKRLSDIGVGNSSGNLRVVALWRTPTEEADIGYEKCLHELLDALGYRVRGEWFTLSGFMSLARDVIARDVVMQSETGLSDFFVTDQNEIKQALQTERQMAANLPKVNIFDKCAFLAKNIGQKKTESLLNRLEDDAKIVAKASHVVDELIAPKPKLKPSRFLKLVQMSREP